jgi:hypothetical protein
MVFYAIAFSPSYDNENFVAPGRRTSVAQARSMLFGVFGGPAEKLAAQGPLSGPAVFCGPREKVVAQGPSFDPAAFLQSTNNRKA